MTGEIVYLDASAAVKLVRDERESRALSEALQPDVPGLSSHLLEVELWCYSQRVSPAARGRVRELIDRLTLVPLTEAMRNRASERFDPPQTALDAIHLATALDLDLDELVFLSYDERQLEAARSAGLTTASPGA